MSMGRRVYLTMEEIDHIQHALDVLTSDYSGHEDNGDEVMENRFKEIERIGDKLALKLQKAKERKGV